MNLSRHMRNQGEAKPPLPPIEMPPTELESSTTHFEVLDLEGQVLGLGLEAWSPRKLLCPRLEDSTIFLRLKFCWKTPEISRKTLPRPVLFSSFGDRLKKKFEDLFFFFLRSLVKFS